jgi:hypothetical protein
MSRYLQIVAAFILLISSFNPVFAQMPMSPFGGMGGINGLGGMGGMGGMGGTGGTGGAPPMRSSAPPKIPHKPGSLDDLFKKTELPEVALPPLLLGKRDWSIFADAAQQALLRSYFVIINDGKVKDFAQVYRANAEEGKASFVTTDAVIHPLLAYRNAVKVKIIEQYCTPKLRSLLLSMIKSSIVDYRQADDPAVKDDVQRNLAYLAIAVKLLSPETQLPDFGGVQVLIDRSLKEITAEKSEQGKSIELAVFQPIGWYKSTETLRRYYRCRQWLGRTSFLLSDVSDNSESLNGNEFRRSILLYRSLEHARIGESRSFELWQQLNQAFNLLDDEHLASYYLLPSDFKAGLNPPSGGVQSEVEVDKKISLEEMAQPLARAKVLLSLRLEHNRLVSRSIFELDARARREDENLSFRFFPPCPLIEAEWLISQSPNSDVFSGMPFSLLFLHSRAAAEADNILADNTAKLEEQLVRSLPVLDRVVFEEAQMHSASSIWPVLAAAWKVPPETAQPVLRTEFWQMRVLETSLAGWVDDWISVAPADQLPAGRTDSTDSVSPNISQTTSTNSSENPMQKQAANGIGMQESTSLTNAKVAHTASPTTIAPANQTNISAVNQTKDANATQATASSLRKPSRFNYLEPAPEFYKQLSTSLTTWKEGLSKIGMFPDDCRTRTDDFIRLTQRLSVIAKKELAAQPFTASDAELIANFDYVLDKIEAPMIGSIYFAFGPPQPNIPAPQPTGKVVARAQAPSGQQRPVAGTVKDRNKESVSLNAPVNTAVNNSANPSANLSTNTPANASANASANAAAQNIQGVNLGLGTPATLYVVLRTPRGPVVCRGAVYSYYEVHDQPMTQEHWLRNLQYGFFRPPFWCDSFHLVNNTQSKKP